RDLGVAVDLLRVDAAVAEAAHLGEHLLGDGPLFGLQLRVGEQQGGVEVAEEQPLGEAERLRAGEEQFLGLLFLLLDLCGGERYDDSPWTGRDLGQSWADILPTSFILPSRRAVTG